MGQFNINIDKSNSDVFVKIEGHIDEDAQFSAASLDGAEKIDIDLDKVSAINSCGIREWIKWIRTAPENAKIIYKNCPKVIVDQINMVAGFLPDKAEVDSFYVPYYCDSTGNEKMVLFQKGKEFSEGSVAPPEDIKDDETGEEMELDVIEAKYFKFITD